MLVRDVIKAMESQELTGKKLAEQYGVSARTISKKISGLGYKYDNTAKTYSFVGTDLVAVESLDFGSLFDPITARKAVTPGTATAVSPKQATAKPTARKNVTTRKAVTPKAVKAVTPAESPEKPLDSIDMLLLHSEKPERTYRGYYFDADILAVIDRAGNKSALINEALRVVFTAKGLL